MTIQNFSFSTLKGKEKKMHRGRHFKFLDNQKMKWKETDSSTLDSNNDGKIYPIIEISESESSDDSILMIFLKFKNQHMNNVFF